MSDPVRVVQLSDTHVLEPDAEAEGAHSYVLDGAFDAVIEHLADRADLDLVVVTGDVADHGRPEQYELAAEGFARLPTPVNVCPGNHDRQVELEVGVTRPGVSTSRVVRSGPWAMLFVDSCAGLQSVDDHGLHHDPPGEARLHTNGCLGAREAAWIRRAHDVLDVEHVMVWLHHPPTTDVGLCRDGAYTAEWEALIADLPRVRAFGAGHTHVPAEHEIAGRPVFVAPSLKNNFDREAQTWLPPGYRSYELHDDGTVTSELCLVDDERWPRRPYGRLIRSLLAGEIGHGEMEEILRRRAAAQQA